MGYPKSKKWILKQPDSEKVHQLKSQLGASETVCQLLVNREIESYVEAKKFFRPDIENLYDPYTMLNMQKVVERLQKALLQNEKVLAYGDYDVDGTMSVSMFSNFFIKREADILFYIPDRFSEGYGLSRKGIDFALENNVHLLVTMDCGIKDVENIQYAISQGLEVIVIDHHTPDITLPPTEYILNPKQKNDPYPYKDLSAGGVTFKLLSAWSIMECGSLDNALEYIDLAAISTAADVVPLTDENRLILQIGLSKINNRENQVVQKLLETAGRNKTTIDEYDLGYLLGPRINAIGRLGKATDVVELFTTLDYSILENQAKYFSERNEERKSIDKNITQEALEKLSKEEDNISAKSTVVFSDNWHKGVIGIVASRLVDHYYRPTVVCTQDGDSITCSARSIENFNILEALNECQELFEKHGGHFYAAGLTLPSQNMNSFKEKFEQVVSENITEEMLTPKLYLEGILAAEDISMRLYNTLAQMAPFGEKNPKPLFEMQEVTITKGTLKNLKDKHVTFVIEQNGVHYKAIGFNMPEAYEILSQNQDKKLNLAVELMRNEWQGNVNLELLIKDYKFC